MLCFQCDSRAGQFSLHACAATLPLPLSTTTEPQWQSSGWPRNGFSPTAAPTTALRIIIIISPPSSCASQLQSCIQVSPLMQISVFKCQLMVDNNAENIGLKNHLIIKTILCESETYITYLGTYVQFLSTNNSNINCYTQQPFQR